MPLRARRLALVRDAIEIVRRRLSAMAPSSEVEELQRRAADYLREAEGWQTAEPSVEHRENLAKRVLALHVSVVRLERQGPTKAEP